MLQIAYLGGGGKYANYMKEAVKRILRLRAIKLQNTLPGSTKGTRIAIHHSGIPLEQAELNILLSQEDVCFVIGDSRGLTEDFLKSCHKVYSVSSLPVSHPLEAAILTEQIERITIYGSTESGEILNVV